MGSVALDITDTILASEALRRSERRYREIFEIAEEGIWLIDADANTEEVNHRMAEMLDYISRNGENEVFDPTGEGFSAIGEEMGLAARDVLQHYGRELTTGPIGAGTFVGKKGRPRSRVSTPPTSRAGSRS